MSYANIPIDCERCGRELRADWHVLGNEYICEVCAILLKPQQLELTPTELWMEHRGHSTNTNTEGA